MEVEVKTPRKLHSREELAGTLNISLRAADELILTKQIASLKIGRRRLVSSDAIADFIRKKERASR